MAISRTVILWKSSFRRLIIFTRTQMTLLNYFVVQKSCKRWPLCFQVCPNAILFNLLQFCPSVLLSGVFLLILCFSTAWNSYFDISVFPVKFSLSAEVLNPLSHVVCYTAVFSVVTQRNATQRNVTTLKTAVQQTTLPRRCCQGFITCLWVRNKWRKPNDVCVRGHLKWRGLAP